YNTNELLTNQYFLFQGGYIRKIGTLSPLVGGKVLFFAGADIGKAYYVENASHLPSDGSAGLLTNTLLGPIVEGGAVGDAGHTITSSKLAAHISDVRRRLKALANQAR